MTDDDFRDLALGLDGVVEGAHMGHPDFRVNNRIFAACASPDVSPKGRTRSAQSKI